MKYHEEAKAVFDGYAGMDAPDLPTNKWQAIQVRLARWQNRNFGPQPATHCALGIGEEVGELIEGFNHDEVYDACGDILVYACQLATDHRLDFGTLVAAAAIPDAMGCDKLAKAVGRIDHAVLKSAQKIRGFDDKEKTREWIAAGIVQLIGALDGFVAHRFDIMDAWEEVAEQVMKRDWTNNRVTGSMAS